MYLKNIIVISAAMLLACSELPAQPDRRTPPGGGNGRPPGGMRGGRDNSSRAPEGAYYKLSDGSSKVSDSETFATDSSDYNVVQVTNGTLTLTDVTLNVPSGILMLVDYNTQWRTYGGIGNLILQTTKDAWEYSGRVEADIYSTANVTVGNKVTWKGSNDSAKTAKDTSVTVEKGGKWVLTADSKVTNIVNNGTIDRNGFTLTYTTMNGDGVVQH